MTRDSVGEAIGPAAPGRHLPALDGLRGIAALLVLAHHFVGAFVPATRLDAWLLALPGAGWIGVDLFFVLSGYLITGILWQAKGTADYFRRFYLRRALRIFPLYYGLLIGFLVILPRIGFAGDDNIAALAEQQGWYWTYLTNWLLALRGAEAVPLVHLWSLALEEQFYLVWPAVVLLCSRRALIRTCLAMVLGAPLFRLALVLGNAGPDAAYVLTPARVDALALGALLALGVPYAGDAARQRALAHRVARWGAMAVAVLIAVRGSLDSAVPEVQIVGFSVIACVAAAVLALVLLTPQDAPGLRVLRHPWLRACGTVSYGLYVLHYPLFGLLQRVVDLKAAPLLLGSVVPAALAFVVVATLLSLVVASASWMLWERPFLRLKDRLSGARSVP